MTPLSRRSTAISRGSHSILRKAGLASAAAVPSMLRLPKYRPLCGSLFLSSPLRGDDSEVGLPRRHADRAVEPDGLAIEHRILDDVHRKRAIFRCLAKPRRMRHLGAKALARLLVQAHQQRGEEDAGRDGVHADFLAGEI